MEKPTEAAAIFRAAEKYASEMDCDVLAFNGDIDMNASDVVHRKISERPAHRKSLLLLLTTYGGDPHEAYRIARRILGSYESFSVLIRGYCKSAGTLIVLGAAELIMSQQAELGPLDVQLPKQDELFSRTSGLSPTEALDVLDSRASAAFIRTFLEMKGKLRLSTTTAADAAAAVVRGTYESVYAQIDPISLGEVNRQMRVALHYGFRLIASGKNAGEQAVVRLVSGYPSHSFVIDQLEAKELFECVRPPTAQEDELVSSFSARPASVDGPLVVYFNHDAPTQASHPTN